MYNYIICVNNFIWCVIFSVYLPTSYNEICSLLHYELLQRYNIHTYFKIKFWIIMIGHNGKISTRSMIQVHVPLV